MNSRSHSPVRGATPRAGVLPVALTGAGAAAALVWGPLAAALVAVGSLWMSLVSLPAVLSMYIVLAAFPIGVTFHGHHFELSDVVALMAMAGLIRKFRAERTNMISGFLAKPFRGPLVLLFGLAVLSLAVSISHVTTVVKILEYVEFFLVIVAVAHDAGWDERAWRLILLSLFVTVAAVALYGTWQFLFQIGPAANIIDTYHIRADAWFGQPNAFGGFVGDTFPLLLALVWAGPEWARRSWLLWALLAVDALGVMVSFSRGAWVADAGAVFFMGVLALSLGGWKQIGWRYLLAGIAVPVAMFVVVYLLGKVNLTGHAITAVSYQTTGARLRSSVTAVFNPNGHFNTAQRLIIWKSAIAAMVSHPWLGVGLGGFHRYIATHPPKGLALVPPMAHNLYFEWGADLGVGGIVAALWLQWTWLSTAIGAMRRRARTWPRFWYALGLGAFGTVVSFIMHNWVDFMIDHGVIVPLLMAMAILWVLSDRVANRRRGH
ncbi:MAG: O-antigen ligase family protein [Thermaerobacter sp.]|nr:O-antigen ligase family protein [Thermaerobacter sp.]